MNKRIFKIDDFDVRLRKEFAKLPVENVSPQTKLKIIERIERNWVKIRLENILLGILYRTSQIALVASIAIMLFFLPVLLPFEHKVPMNEQAAIETYPSAKTNLVAKTNQSSFDHSPPLHFHNYPTYHTIKYVSYP